MLFPAFRSKPTASFHTPLATATVIGTVLTVAYLGLMFAGPLNFALLRRYSLGNPIAIIMVWIFCIACIVMVQKWFASATQAMLAKEGKEALEELVLGIPQDESDRVQWLETMWKCQPSKLTGSWFGQRITSVIARQRQRGHVKYLESDLRELADRDRTHLNEEYGLIRMATWAMPLLGGLGTVLAVSGTLGQIDAQSLASDSQTAMHSLARGLYVAFDTTAMGLALMLGTMFLHFGVHRKEQSLLVGIDQQAADQLQSVLAESESRPDLANLEGLLTKITSTLATSVQQMVQNQAELWRETISEAHDQWSTLTTSASQGVAHALTAAIEHAMALHREGITRHVEQISQIQNDGAILIDARWQQWQTTLSEQARATHQHQRDINALAELLRDLIEKNDSIRSVDESLQTTLQRLTDIDRFHDAAICLTEAVAVLGIQMERNGVLGRQSARRKPADSHAGEDSNDESQIIPLKRRAG